MVAVSCEREGRKRSGGVALLWSNFFTIVSMSLNHIDTTFCIDGEGQWRFTGLNGHPEDTQKYKTGELLTSLRGESEIPWVCGGDFNLMLYSHEKKGGSGFNVGDATLFREAMDRYELHDLGYTSYNFMWSNNQSGESNIQERIDRFIASHAWKGMFSGSFVSHLTKRKSDHLPILLHVNSGPQAREKRKPRKIFRFEGM